MNQPFECRRVRDAKLACVSNGSTSRASGFLSGLAAVWVMGAAWGCAPPAPAPPSPRASVVASGESSTTSAPPPRIVRKPEVAAARLLDPWEELSERKAQLDEDIDRWLAAARHLTSPPQAQRLLVLRRLHGTGGFLRQAQRELREHSTEYPAALTPALDELASRWEQFEQRLADMNRAQALTRPSPR